MIFSVNYRSAHKANAEEIRCPYNQLGLIFDFIKENPEKRFNIIINNDITEVELTRAIEQIEFVKEVSENYTIECGHIKVLHILLDQGYNAYLKFHVSDWEIFNQLKELGVSDIYIDGSLGFQTNKIKSGKGNTLIRVSPTVSPNASLLSVRPIDSFFIRPEDLYLYDNIIDIVDFQVPQQEQEDALFNIYKRKNFNYNLNDLVKGLSIDTNNLLIKDDFAKTRLNCSQRCKIPGYSCHNCSNYFVVTNQLLNLINVSD